MVRMPDSSSSRSTAEAVDGISAEALVSLRGDMLRFARLQLRNADAAEDLVQEAIEAALRQGTKFGGRSTLKTWVFAILRNRIVDHLRAARRSVPMSSLVDEGEDWLQRLESLFDEKGGWRDGSRPAAWPSPEQSMQTRQFWRVFEACLDHLRPNTGRVFMMREFLGFECDEICSQLGISAGNCHVILHRARLKLRGCIEAGWGRPGEGSC
jgi:RNA polymerase sigma-70 factor, ECF subfamily